MRARDVEAVELLGTTDAAGALVMESEPIVGQLVAVIASGDDLDAGATLTLKTLYDRAGAGARLAGETLVNAVDIGTADLTALYPRRFGQDNANADLLLATGAKTAVPFAVAGVLEATIAAGGNAKKARVRVLVER